MQSAIFAKTKVLTAIKRNILIVTALTLMLVLFTGLTPKADALGASSRVWNNNYNQNYVSMWNAPNPRFSTSRGLIPDGGKFWMQCYVIQSTYPFYGNYSSTKWFYGYANETGWGYVHSSYVYYQIYVNRC